MQFFHIFFVSNNFFFFYFFGVVGGGEGGGSLVSEGDQKNFGPRKEKNHQL